MTQVEWLEATDKRSMQVILQAWGDIMNRRYASERYTTNLVKDRSAGYEGYELIIEANGATKAVARIVYWDAAPGFFVEMFDSTASIPLDIFQEFIAETMVNMNAS